MRKILVLAFSFLIALSAFSQKVEAGNKLSQVNQEIKSALVAKLNLSDLAADQIIVSENEFFSKLEAIRVLVETSTKEKERKLHEAHTTRRSRLMGIPLTGRQMEDVVFLVESIRRKHNL